MMAYSGNPHDPRELEHETQTARMTRLEKQVAELQKEIGLIKSIVSEGRGSQHELSN